MKERENRINTDFSAFMRFLGILSNILDIDSELQLFFSGVGKVTFEFTGSSDIVEIGQMISRHLL